jgi:predicted ATPase
MKIESIRLKNYKVFRDAHLKDVPPFLVVVGANGAGKSTLFDVFGFLHDCLKGTVRQVLDKRWRYGSPFHFRDFSKGEGCPWITPHECY